MLNSDSLVDAAPEGVQKNATISSSSIPAKVEGRPSRREKDFTLEEVNERIRNLVQPPPPRNLEYFRNVCGLSAMGVNPHKLHERKDIPSDGLRTMFGKGTPRSRFRFNDCKDPAIQQVMQKIWPLCYGKPNIAPARLLSKEFCFGVYAQCEQKKDIDWASFAVETNADQRQKYSMNLRKLEKQRDVLMGVSSQGASNPLAKMGAASECMSRGTVTPQEFCHGVQMSPNFSAETYSRCTNEVKQLLILACLEWGIYRFKSEKLLKENVPT
jgi:hypothetical protein